MHGPYCRYKHTKRSADDLPQVGNFTQGLSQMQAGSMADQPRRAAAVRNEFYKVTLCKHNQHGNCPFGDGCHFAHGEVELKKYKDALNNPNKAPDGTIDERVFGSGADEEGRPAEYVQKAKRAHRMLRGAKPFEPAPCSPTINPRVCIANVSARPPSPSLASRAISPSRAAPFSLSLAPIKLALTKPPSSLAGTTREMLWAAVCPTRLPSRSTRGTS